MDRPATVLLADDDREIRELIELRLRAAGFDVIAVEDGARALEAAERREPDAAVLDVMMPGTDGIDVAAGLRERGIGCAIVMLSALGSASDLRRAYAAGADEYLTKPFDAADLVARLRAAIAARSLQPSSG